MRCKYCGGEISLEMDFCPYCGNPNEHAQQHARDMEEFQEEFEETKSDVHETTHKFTGVTIRVIIIAVLFIVSIVLFICGARAYEFRFNWLEAKAEKNAEEYMEKMDEMLAEEEFAAFYAFCQENHIRTYDTAFEKYTPVERAASQYQYIYNNVMEIAYPSEYADMEFILESLSEYLDWFYSACTMKDYEYLEGVDNEVNRKAMTAMKERVGLLLQTYCGVDAEIVKDFPTMTKGQRAVALEEAVLND